MTKHYHIHVTTEELIKPGWKETSIMLEKGIRKEIHNMYTKNISFSDDTSIDSDIASMLNSYWKDYPNSHRFKIEILDLSKYFEYYTERCYREVHIKLAIQESEFDVIKEQLTKFGLIYEFVLSNNPKEKSDGLITQFINVRHKNCTHIESEDNLNQIKAMLLEDNFSTVNLKEIKDEVTLFDTRRTLDNWWA